MTTTDHDLERTLDEWLASGPTAMPDWVLRGAFERIERAPRHPRPFRITRFTPMHPTFRLAAAAVLALALGLGILPMLSPATPGPDPSPSPSPTPMTLLDSGLAHAWDRSPTSGSAPAGARIMFTIPGSLAINAGDEVNLWQSVTIPAPGLLDVALFPGLAGCGDAEDASYAWALSPGGTRLTLTPVVDECPERRAVLAGEFQRGECPWTGNRCVGTLEEGRYFSTVLAPGPQGTATQGGLVYDVPAGWANTEDTVASFLLMPEASRDLRLSDPSLWPAMIVVLPRPSAARQTPDCSNPPEPGVGHTIDDLVGWLTSNPGLTTGEPTPIIIGPYRGVQLDVDIATSWTTTCTGYNSPVVAAIRTLDGTGEVASWEVGGLGMSRDPARFLFLQIDEENVVLVIVYPGLTTPEAFYPEAMPVVESMRFRP